MASLSNRILTILVLATLLPFLTGATIIIRGPRVAAAGGTDFSTSLVAYYKLDEASGNAVDAHSTKTLTEAVVTVGTVTGKLNDARNFDGGVTDGAYFSRADDVDFEPGSSAFFVTMWVKAGSLAQAAYPSIVGKWAGSNIEWGILFYDDGNFPYIVASSDGAAQTAAIDDTAFPDTSTWMFIAAGWDGTDIKISVNGGAFVTTAFAGPLHTGTAAIEMGSRSGGTVVFNGDVDEVAFWKGRHLSLSEVQEIYNSGNGLAYESF